MLKYYARTFLPWIVLAVGSTITPTVGALAGLATALVLLALDRRAGRELAELTLDISTAMFMAVWSVVVVALPHSPLLGYGTALSMAWLAVTAWLGLALGRPFVAAIARHQVDENAARAPLFRRMCGVITAVWAACFTLEALTLAMVQSQFSHALGIQIACKVAFIAAAACFTAVYSDTVRKQAARLQLV